MKALLVRLMMKVSGKTQERLQLDFLFWHFVTRSRLKAYCCAVLKGETPAEASQGVA